MVFRLLYPDSTVCRNNVVKEADLHRNERNLPDYLSTRLMVHVCTLEIIVWLTARGYSEGCYAAYF